MNIKFIIVLFCLIITSFQVYSENQDDATDTEKEALFRHEETRAIWHIYNNEGVLYGLPRFYTEQGAFLWLYDIMEKYLIKLRDKKDPFIVNGRGLKMEHELVFVTGSTSKRFFFNEQWIGDGEVFLPFEKNDNQVISKLMKRFEYQEEKDDFLNFDWDEYNERENVYRQDDEIKNVIAAYKRGHDRRGVMLDSYYGDDRMVFDEKLGKFVFVDNNMPELSIMLGQNEKKESTQELEANLVLEFELEKTEIDLKESFVDSKFKVGSEYFGELNISTEANNHLENNFTPNNDVAGIFPNFYLKGLSFVITFILGLVVYRILNASNKKIVITQGN